MTVSGKQRLLVSAPGILQLYDIAGDGRALVSQSNARLKLFVRRPDDPIARDLSWLDWSLLRDMTLDGRRVLFDETGEGAGKTSLVYVRNTDGSPAVRLGEGLAASFSPDGRFVLAIRERPEPAQLVIYPTAAGDAPQLARDTLNHGPAAWTPDGRSIVFRASEGSHPQRLYVQNLAGGAPRSLSPEGVSANPICSPDGRWVCSRGPDGIVTLFPLNGGAEIKLPELALQDGVIRFTTDGKALLYARRSENPARIFTLDLATRRSQLFKEIALPESMFGLASIRISADGRTYAYSLFTASSDLYQLEGVE